MQRRSITTAIAILALAGVACSSGGAPAQTPTPREGPVFSDPRTIDHPYLPLSLYRRCVLEGVDEGARIRIVRAPVERTQTIRWRGQTIEALVMRDREFEDGSLVEETFDFFAQSDDGTVYYLGEDVSDYEDGRLVGHHGTWRLGLDTDHPGVVMPADVAVGAMFKPENVPGITVEDATIDRDGLALTVDAGSYTEVIRIREDHPKGVVEHKFYAPEIGLLREQGRKVLIDLVGCEA